MNSSSETIRLFLHIELVVMKEPIERAGCIPRYYTEQSTFRQHQVA